MSEKSKGVLLFATNTAETDYVGIAETNAKLIEKFLGLPTTIVQGHTTGNKRLVDGAVVEWNNGGRCDAYDLSPYDQTLLIDSDYLMLDKSLLATLETVDDYAIPHKNIYVNSLATVDSMGPYAISPMLWATAIAFNKTPKAKALFDLVKIIQKNYSYYRSLYKIQPRNFRNDVAFTIADRIINGYVENPANRIPWPIVTISGKLNELRIEENRIVACAETEAYVLPKRNLHIHDKTVLQSAAFKEAVNNA